MFVPDHQYFHVFAGATTKPLRGFRGILALYDSATKCIGWILESDAKRCKDGFCNPRVDQLINSNKPFSFLKVS